QLLFQRRAILLLADRLVAELVEEQLDLVEVQALVDRDHETEVLERARHDLRRRAVDQLGQLGDRQELVDPDGPRLLGAHPLALGLALQAADGLLPAMTALLPTGPQLRHDALEVLLHGALVDAALLLLATLLLTPPVGREALGLDADLPARPRAGGGRRRHGPRRQRKPFRHPARATRHRLRGRRGRRRLGRPARRLGLWSRRLLTRRNGFPFRLGRRRLRFDCRFGLR